MCFSGFFIAVSDSPDWINWMCAIFPLRWSLEGFVYQIFNTQDFKISGTTATMSGTDILDKVFNLNSDKVPSNGWAFFGVLMGYVMLFRVAQYFLFAYQTNTLWTTREGASKAVVPGIVAAANDSVSKA